MKQPAKKKKKMRSPDPGPGPGTYDLLNMESPARKSQMNRKFSSPTFSKGKRGDFSRPEIPGPGSYSHENLLQGPKFTVGKRPRSFDKQTPGPGHYTTHRHHEGPSFSLSKRLERSE